MSERKKHRGFKLSDLTNQALRRQALALGSTETAIVERAIAEFDAAHPCGPHNANPVGELKSVLTRATELANSLPTAS